MLVQEKDHNGNLVNNYQTWTTDFYAKMVNKWGAKLRWVKVDQQTGVTKVEDVYISDCTDQKIETIPVKGRAKIKKK